MPARALRRRRSARVYVPNLNTVVFNTSYVTGSHALKFGFTDTFGYSITTQNDIPEAVAYRFNNGVPNLIQMRATPYESRTNMRAELGLYVQDRWTMDKLTLTGGVRFDWLSYWYPATHVGPGPLAPTRDFTTDEKESVNWKDITPRVGVSYDVFGTGKTAVKVSVGRYVINADSGNSTAPANPITALAVTTNRPWNDRGGLGINGDYTPQCDLLNFNANGECGEVDNRNFGGRVPTRADDPATYNGWGTRAYNWEFSTSVQHETRAAGCRRCGVFPPHLRQLHRPGQSGYDGGRLHAVQHDGAARFPTPRRWRLPGERTLRPQPEQSWADQQPGDLCRQLRKVHRTLERRGLHGQRTARSTGVVVQGGVSTGRTSTDVCEIRDKIPELTVSSGWSAFPVLGPTYPYCKVDTNFLTQVKLLGTYNIPKIDVLLGATFQSVPGPHLGSLYVLSSGQAATTLGRPLSGGVANVTVNILESGKYYVDRSNMLDVRLGKLIRFGSRRASVNLDIHNLMNGSGVLLLNNNYSAWLTPQAILEARLFKISTSLDF